MTHKHKLKAHNEQPLSYTVRDSGLGFVFSDDINDWITSVKIKHNSKARERYQKKRRYL